MIDNFATTRRAVGRGNGRAATLLHAVTGEPIAAASSEGLDFKGMLEYARHSAGRRCGR